MTVADAEKNYMKGYKLGSIQDEELEDGEDDKTSEVINVNELSEDERVDTAGTNSFSPSSSNKKKIKKKKSKVPSDFKELKNNYTGTLLPSRVQTKT